MSYAKDFARIYNVVDSIKVFSDHEHHLPDQCFKDGFTLQKLIDYSYLFWMLGGENQRVMPERKEFFDRLRFNSYFHWFERGLQEVHGHDLKFNFENWETIDSRVTKAYQNKDFHWQTLMRHGYDKIILDAYWDPGSDDGHPEIFTPTFRIDKFGFGYHKDATTRLDAPHIGPELFCPWKRYGFAGKTLSDYVDMAQSILTERYQAGKFVSLKTAIAYDRTVDFYPDSKELAEKAFGKAPGEITPQEQRHFLNYIFHRCFEVAAKLDIPVQIHTGLADLRGSNPMLIEPLLRQYPQIRFILFHSGYPWSAEVAALAHNFTNAFPSLTWTPIISTSAAIRILDEFIDVAPNINTITWGGDSWVAEESVGAQLAWKHVVASVLTKRYRERMLSANDVEVLAEKLLLTNGRSVYLEK